MPKKISFLLSADKLCQVDFSGGTSDQLKRHSRGEFPLEWWRALRAPSADSERAAAAKTAAPPSCRGRAAREKITLVDTRVSVRQTANTLVCFLSFAGKERASHLDPSSYGIEDQMFCCVNEIVLRQQLVKQLERQVHELLMIRQHHKVLTNKPETRKIAAPAPRHHECE